MMTPRSPRMLFWVMKLPALLVAVALVLCLQEFHSGPYRWLAEWRAEGGAKAVGGAAFTFVLTLLLVWLPVAVTVELLVAWSVHMLRRSGEPGPSIQPAGRLARLRPYLVWSGRGLLGGTAAVVLLSLADSPAAAMVWHILLGLGLGGALATGLLGGLAARREWRQRRELEALLRAKGWKMLSVEPNFAAAPPDAIMASECCPTREETAPDAIRR
jgi:hypothetical protein